MPRIEKQVMILNKKGLPARAAVAFVDTVKSFKSTVTVVKDEMKVNGKSAMALLTFGAKYQTPLQLIIEGDDAAEATRACEDFFTKQRIFFGASNSLLFE